MAPPDTAQPLRRQEPPAALTSGLSGRTALIVGLVIAAWIAIPGAIVGLIVAPVLPGGWWTLGAVFAYAFFSVAVRILTWVSRRAPGALVRLLLLQPFLYLFFFLPLLAIIGILGLLVGWPLGAPLLSARASITVLAAFFVALALLGYFGTKHLVVRPIEVAHPRVPLEFDGLRIVQLSDLHVGPHSSKHFLARVAREIERARPDIIAHTGDQVDDYQQDVAHFVRAFGHLRAPLGVYAIAGNHDVYAGWRGVRDGMRAGGIRVLVNEGVTLTRGDARLWIGGTGDPAGEQFAKMVPDAPAPDLDGTMSSAPADAFRVVLAHNPCLWRGLVARGAHLTLSGHTHHGQISIPALNWCIWSPFIEHVMGRYDDGESVLYVHPGSNYWGLPLRVGAWPEVAVVTLRRAVP